MQPCGFKSGPMGNTLWFPFTIAHSDLALGLLTLMASVSSFANGNKISLLVTLWDCKVNCECQVNFKIVKACKFAAIFKDEKRQMQPVSIIRK